MELNEILKIALKGGASDIHLKSGLPPMFRVDGALVPLKNGERLMPEYIQKIAVQIMNPIQKNRFEETRERGGLSMTFTDIHRPLQDYFDALGSAGFLVEALKEPRPSAERIAAVASAQRWLKEPAFLFVRAVKA